MNVIDFIKHIRSGGKATSDTFTLATGLSFVKRGVITLEYKEVEKLVGVTMDGENEILSNVRLVDLMKYNDWELVS
jgi:hypothetical protein